MLKAGWRRKFGAGVAIGALVVTTGWTGAQAQEILPGVVDIAVSVDQEIQTVTWDQWARDDWQVSNVGLEPSTSSTLTVKLPAGSVLRSSPLSYPCTAAGTTVTCQIGALASGSSQTVTVFYDVPDVAATLVATASLKNNSLLAAVDLLGNTLEYTPNNTAAATTNVVAPGQGGGSGWIPPCGTMSTGVNAVDGRVGTLANGERREDGSCTRTVPLGVVELEFAAAGSDQECTPGEPGSCSNGFKKTFTAETEQNLTNLAPAKWTISYGIDAKCTGVGFPADCPGARTFYFEDEGDNTPEDPGQCPGSSSGGGAGDGLGITDDDGYCVNRRFKVGGQIHIELLISHNGIDLGAILGNK